jgi:hypothetical protein
MFDAVDHRSPSQTSQCTPQITRMDADFIAPSQMGHGFGGWTRIPSHASQGRIAKNTKVGRRKDIAFNKWEFGNWYGVKLPGKAIPAAS